MKKNDIIAITMGDPAGIGAEVIVKALNRLEKIGDSSLLIIGDSTIIQHYAEKYAISIPPIKVIDNPSEVDSSFLNVIEPIQVENITPATVSVECGKASYKYIEKSIELALNGEIDAVVTCPINKEALKCAGYNYPGHTEIFAEKCGVDNFSMMFTLEDVSIVHVTTHCSLLEAIELITVDRVYKNIELLHTTLISMGYKSPRIAVGGLNPHAGENGLFGTEEIEHIIPAIEKAQKKGINATGPFPPDTIFMSAFKGNYDGVVSMLHDHGFVAVKSREFEKGVNVTVGLPIIRTSVGHGTAFDIVGKGVASPESLITAFTYANNMIQTKKEK